LPSVVPTLPAPMIPMFMIWSFAAEFDMFKLDS